MIQVNFVFEGQNITIQCNKNEVIKEIFKKFEIKANIGNKSVYYLYNGNKLNDDKNLEEIIGNNININIIVNSINEMKNNSLINNKCCIILNKILYKNKYIFYLSDLCKINVY